MAKDLLSWAAEQTEWVKDSLRRIAIAADYSVEQVDADCILDNVRAAPRADSSVHHIVDFHPELTQVSSG